jgi:hypothetical protein
MIRNQNLIGFLFFVLLVTFVFFMAYKEDKGLRVHKKITQGTVYEITTYRSNGRSVFIKYHFVIDNKEFNGQSSISSNHKFDDCKYLRHILIGYSFPIIYDSTDFDNSIILLSKSDYQRFNVIRSDTLNYFNNIVDSLQSIN